MRIVGAPSEYNGQTEVNVAINQDEVDALNESISFWRDRHKDDDPTDNINKQLKQLEEDLHRLFVLLNPS